MVEVQAERRELPCANPHLVKEYVAIEDILQGDSNDWEECGRCGGRLCEHVLNSKRQDESYKVLVEHLREGGAVNEPLNYDPRTENMGNGHHRLAAALDAGFTHVPVNPKRWGDNNWNDTDPEQYGFKLVSDGWGGKYIEESKD
jgi:hypothetical protein